MLIGWALGVNGYLENSNNANVIITLGVPTTWLNHYQRENLL